MVATKDWENKSMIAAYEEVYDKLEAHGHRPQLHILDNECSKCIQNYLHRRKVNQMPSRCTPCPQVKCRQTSCQNGKISSHCGTSNARLGLPHPTVEQDAQTSLGHTQHVTGMQCQLRRWAPKAAYTSTPTTATRSHRTAAKGSLLAVHHTTTAYLNSTSQPPEDTASAEHTASIPNTAACL